MGKCQALTTLRYGDMALDSHHEVEALVLRSLGGDEFAFENLIKIYHGRLLYYLRRILRDPDRAEDVLQNVWFAVYRQLPTLRSTKAFPVWLYRITRNQANREIRQIIKYAASTESLEDLPYEIVSEEEEKDFSAEDAALVHQCLNTLKPEYCEVLTLRFMEELSYQEIAEVMGCGVGTVKSRIHYAKQALALRMEEKANE